MKIKYLSIILLFVTSLFLLTSCEIKEVEVGKLESFKIVKITKEYITLDIAAPLKNDNNFSFTIQKAQLDITFNNIKLGRIDKIEKVRVKKKSNDVHHFIFRVPLKEMLGGGLLSIPALLSNKANIKVVGFVKASTWLFFSKKIDVNYSKRIKLSGAN